MHPEANFYATELQLLMTVYSEYPCYPETGPANASKLCAAPPDPHRNDEQA